MRPNVVSRGWRVAELASIASAFCTKLRRAGLNISLDRSRSFVNAIALCEPASLDELYWISRVTLLTDRSQFDTFDVVFNAVFRGSFELNDERPPSTTPGATRDPHGERAPNEPRHSGEHAGTPTSTSATPGAEADDDESHAPSVLAAVSDQERVRHTEFSALTREELQLIASLVERLPVIPPTRRGRRSRRDRRGDRIDVRATLRRAQRSGGDPFRVVRRKRTRKPRRIVLIADVSGSMEPYARVYFHLMRGAVTAIGAESFVFATRLTRITTALSQHRPERAYQSALDAAVDVYGGTRIGRSLLEFVEHHGRRGMARGAVMVIVSDGWERDDVEAVRVAMQRLSRLAHHIIWVNPRKASAEYQPLVGGMSAALPFVDTFVSGHSYHALEEVMDAISTAGERR